MKDVIKILGVLLMGIIVVIFFYPFLHELGHTIAIIFTGSTLYELDLFPIPYVICDSKNVGTFGIATIGVSGMLLPFVFSVFLRSKRFWVWLFSFYLKSISALAFALSYVAVLCYESQIIWQNEDIIKTIEGTGISSSFWLILMLILFCLSVSNIYFNKPIERIEKFFEI